MDDGGALRSTESRHNRDMNSLVKAEWIENLKEGDKVVLKLFSHDGLRLERTIYDATIKNVDKNHGIINSITVSYVDEHGGEQTDKIPSNEFF